jgi:hypothetical protein
VDESTEKLGIDDRDRNGDANLLNLSGRKRQQREEVGEDLIEHGRVIAFHGRGRESEDEEIMRQS